MTLMYRLVPPHIYISLCVFGWGLVASFQCLTTSFGGMVVLRALLGITEAAFGPGVPFYLSLFYRRHELAFRNGLFISAAPLATSFASSLAYLIVRFSSNGPIAPWRTLFLVEGFPSVIVAVFAWFLIPDSPGQARFLTRRQRVVAQQRLEENTADYQQSYGSKFNWREILKTAADPKAYIAAVSAIYTWTCRRILMRLLQFMFFSCNVAFSSMPVFLPTIIKEYVLCQLTCIYSAAYSYSPQHGVLLITSTSSLSTSLPCRLHRSPPYRICLRSQPLPKPIPYNACAHIVSRLSRNCSHRLLPLIPLSMATHLHPVHLRVPRHGGILLRHNPHHHLVNG